MIKRSKDKSNDPNQNQMIKWSKWLFDLHNQMIKMIIWIIQMIQMAHSQTMLHVLVYGSDCIEKNIT